MHISKQKSEVELTNGINNRKYLENLPMTTEKAKKRNMKELYDTSKKPA